MLAATFTIFAGLTLCPVILFGAPQSLPQEAAETISIIPQPLSVKRDDGTFAIGPSTAVVVANKDKDLLLSVGEHSAARLRQATAYALDLRVAVGVKERAGAIVLALDPADADLGDEGYRLKVTNAPVVIKGSKPAGVFYGVQTFYQLLPVEVEKSQPTPGIAWSVPCIRIEDKPRFPWRGMHLDVGRHFFSKDSVKRYIDLLAAYKVNTFHWYLTEDQGWRIEIKKYPRLTSVGAWRKETMDNNIPHGGFYTQDEIREVVEYAKERFVTVVPEIEMPGHSQAALASYPELSCSGGAISSRERVGRDVRRL